MSAMHDIDKEPAPGQRPPRRRKVLAIAVATLAAIGLVAACGSSLPASPSSAATSPSPNPRASIESAAVDCTLAGGTWDGASCSPAPTSAGTSTPVDTPAPPSATPSSQTQAIDWSQNDTSALAQVIESYFAPLAKGKGVPGSARYAGDAHPMAFLYTTNSTIHDFDWEAGIAYKYGPPSTLDNNTLFSPPDSGNPLLFTKTSQVQLVAVVNDAWVQGGSCGTYTRSDGRQGELLQTKEVVTVTIRAALTGKVIATKTFTGILPSCPQQVSGPDLNDDPPWRIYSVYLFYDGSSASDPALKKWIESFLTGPVHT